MSIKAEEILNDNGEHEAVKDFLDQTLCTGTRLVDIIYHYVEAIKHLCTYICFRYKVTATLQAGHLVLGKLGNITDLTAEEIQLVQVTLLL